MVEPEAPAWARGESDEEEGSEEGKDDRDDKGEEKGEDEDEEDDGDDKGEDEDEEDDGDDKGEDKDEDEDEDEEMDDNEDDEQVTAGRVKGQGGGQSTSAGAGGDDPVLAPFTLHQLGWLAVDDGDAIKEEEFPPALQEVRRLVGST